MSIIRQEIVIKASAKKIYDALTTSAQFSTMTGGAPASIDSVCGGELSLFGGMITGRQLDLVPNLRIVQAWRVKLWPEGMFSIVKFELQAKGTDTLLVLEHSAYPEEQGEPLAAGWRTNYIEPLQKYLEKI